RDRPPRGARGLARRVLRLLLRAAAPRGEGKSASLADHPAVRGGIGRLSTAPRPAGAEAGLGRSASRQDRTVAPAADLGIGSAPNTTTEVSSDVRCSVARVQG